jgi:hypothetical protein
MNGRKILIALGVLLLGAAVAAANLWQAETGLTITTEVIKTASTRSCLPRKDSPKRLVNISAETGRWSTSP